MIAIAQFLAISCYLGAAALAAVPFARPVKAPVRGVIAECRTSRVNWLALLRKAAFFREDFNIVCVGGHSYPTSCIRIRLSESGEFSVKQSGFS